MKQVFIKKGEGTVAEVPAPSVSPNTILVRVHYSCISAGTEASDLSSYDDSLVKRAVKQPQNLTKAFDHLRKEGLAKTISKIKNRGGQAEPTGYSAAGEVVKAGAKIKNINPGDKAACAGAGVANHAEYIEVPENLFVKIPEGVSLTDASTVALGAIALQGVRRADLKLGEYAAVIGLGILGQLTVQLLKANGCRVFGTDLSERRIQKALSLGLDEGAQANDSDMVKKVQQFSQGHGVDAVLITASSDSSEPLAQAFQMCRKKGKVVLSGVVGMHINRGDMYPKESDFRISTSYGPGRYDEQYEKQGVDYPYAYVRWTERRNMEEYLRLIADRKINIDSLIEKIHKVEEASKAYAEIKSDVEKPLITLLEYEADTNTEPEAEIHFDTKPLKSEGRIHVALIGAGDFAKNVHLPNLRKLESDFMLQAVVDKVGHNAAAAAKEFGAEAASTDYQSALNDEAIDAVIIATRHNRHARIAMDALNAGKAVFLEKPMAMDQEELNELVQTIKNTGCPFMMGFNRRFSPYAKEAKRRIQSRKSPLIINYQMNAGYIPYDHWVHKEEGGGRIIGEACHIFDLFRFFTDAAVESVSIDKINPNGKYFSEKDNAVITLKYKDGSVCTLTYTALGHKYYPKELCHIYFDGKIIVINNYESIEGFGTKTKNIKSKNPDKGHFEELAAFAKYARGEGPAPISLEQMIEATEVSFKADA